MTRFPLAPLLREAGGYAGLAAALGFSSSHEMEHRTNVYRWRLYGMTWQTADRLACAINLHPSWIWGDAWFLDSARDVPLGWRRKVAA